MAKFWQTLLGRNTPEIARYSLDQYANDISFAFNGGRYLLGGGASTGWAKTEDIESSFTGYINSIYKSNGVVFAIILSRMLLFSEARFCWFDIADNGEDGRPAGRKGLEVLERPWPNASTGELLSRMEQDVSLGGNFYAVREPKRLRRLRPDWLTIVLTAPPAQAVESDVAGYWYHPGRTYFNAGEPVPTDEVYLPDEVAHFSPVPDPDAQYRGMSWLTPGVREVMADKAATDHKLAFFENGATLGPIISAKENLTNAQFKEWKANFEGLHSGTGNAYKPLFLASPVDTNVTTATMQQLEFKVTQGAGETRLCAMGGVPPIIVGLSEGLQSATYSNYGMARRKFGDGWAHPQWKMASTALGNIVEAPHPDVRLGVNTRGIAFLREDAKDLAEIIQIQASAVNTFITAGYKPDSAAAAVEANDLTLLEHTGLTSVQLQKPGSQDLSGGQPDAQAAAADQYQQALDSFRAELDDEDDLWRSEEAEYDEIERKYYDVRVPKGFEGGGRFRSLSDRIGHALNQWLSGDGEHDDPLHGFTRDQLRKASVEFGVTPRRGASTEEIKLGLLTDARARFRAGKDAKSPEAGKPVRFTLKGSDHANLDVGVFTEGGKVSLWEVSDSGQQRKRVALVGDLAGLEKWANDHGESELAGWARKEQGVAPAPDLASLRTLDTEHRRDALDLRKVEGPDGLKAMLRESGLPVSGKKRELVDRLVGHLDGGETASPPKTAAPVPRTPLSPGGADDIAEEFYRHPNYTEQQIHDRLAGLNLAELKKVATATNVPLPRDLIKTEAGPVFQPVKKISADDLRTHIAATIAKDRKLLKNDDKLLVGHLGGGGSAATPPPTQASMRDQLQRYAQSDLMKLASDLDIDLKRAIKRPGPVLTARDLRPTSDSPAPFGTRLRTRDELAREIAKAAAADPKVQAKVDAHLGTLTPLPTRAQPTKPGAVRQGKFDNPAVPARAGTSDSPIRWAEGQDPGWDAARTKRARQALRAYGQASFEINESLRGKPVEEPIFPVEQTAAHIAAIDDLMAASQTTAPMEQWRGLRDARGMFGDRLDGDLTGAEWREDAFVSTSSDKGVSQYFATFGGDGMLMRVNVPTGTGAAQVKDVRGEAEALLQRGLKLRIVADHGVQPGWGYRLVDVEVVPADAP